MKRLPAPRGITRRWPINRLTQLANLIRERNTVDDAIAALIGRPAQMGHIGEYIASAVFDIDLHVSANAKGSDGHFRSGPLAGKTVNVKLYGRQEGMLDINEDALPDYSLVLTGPKGTTLSSRGGTRPLLLSSVYLFTMHDLITARRVDRPAMQFGVATSIPARYWAASELYPTQRNTLLLLSSLQRDQLALFAAPTP